MAGQADLVGRDAEKADLGAAFHQAVNGPSGSGSVVFRAVTAENEVLTVTTSRQLFVEGC